MSKRPRKPRIVLTEEQWVELIAYYQDGHTYLECAKKFGVSSATVGGFFQKHKEIPRRRPLENSKTRQIPGETTEARRKRIDGPPLRKIVKLKDDIYVEGLK